MAHWTVPMQPLGIQRVRSIRSKNSALAPPSERTLCPRRTRWRFGSLPSWRFLLFVFIIAFVVVIIVLIFIIIFVPGCCAATGYRTTACRLFFFLILIFIRVIIGVVVVIIFFIRLATRGSPAL